MGNLNFSMRKKGKKKKREIEWAKEFNLRTEKKFDSLSVCVPFMNFQRWKECWWLDVGVGVDVAIKDLYWVVHIYM